MTTTATETRSVVVERDLPHPPGKVWRALTQPELIDAWLMKTRFQALVGHRFRFEADWGEVACEVRAVEPERCLSYTWDAGELHSIVTFTLTAAGAGTHLRMEQTGFRSDQPRYYGGAAAGWPRFLDRLADVLGETA